MKRSIFSGALGEGEASYIVWQMDKLQKWNKRFPRAEKEWKICERKTKTIRLVLCLLTRFHYFSFCRLRFLILLLRRFSVHFIFVP